MIMGTGGVVERPIQHEAQPMGLETIPLAPINHALNAITYMYIQTTSVNSYRQKINMLSLHSHASMVTTTKLDIFLTFLASYTRMYEWNA